MAETKRERMQKLAAQLKAERTLFDPRYRELGEFIAPDRIRFIESDRNKGMKRNHQKIINPVATLAARTLRSGMVAGISSPARPWRRLTTPDPDLAEYGPVKTWLYTVNRRMTTFDLRSNLYNCLPTVYGDMGVFATAAMGCFDDDDDLMRFYTYPVGSYWLACNPRGVVDTFMREYQLTVRQMVMMFGDPDAGPDRRWENFSPTIRNLWDKGEYETAINIVCVIQPNGEFDPRRLSAKYKRFASTYFEAGQGGNHSLTDMDRSAPFLRESGYDQFPILAPRWDVTGEDVYGTSCPGMDALGDTKEIQEMEKKKSRALSKQLNPPLQAPTALRMQKISELAGDVTFVDVREGMQGIRPIHETNFRVAEVTADIDRKEQRISRTFYEDLFLMIAKLDRREITAREIDERHEEKLLALGPVLERTNDELLDPLTDVQFGKLLKRGLIPPPPQEIAGQDLRVEYISTMAQAQKLVGVAGTERFFAFVGSLAGLYPEVKDKADADQAVEEYGDMMGVSAPIIRSADDVERIRASRAQMQQAVAQAQATVGMAQGAKLLSETDTSTDNALTRVLAGA